MGEDFGSIAVATETGADVTLVAGRLAGALIVTVMEMQLDGVCTTAVWQWSDISCSDILSQFISPTSGWTEALEGHTSTSDANLSFCQHQKEFSTKSGPLTRTLPTTCAIFSYPPPPLPASAIFTSVAPIPESPTIFTRLRRALTFLNEKALFAALQQLTIYDNEASLES
ncbi:unnamed protein product [Pleuronectes platessa]|uniref:Uncharacterized protein n=1 Tax=Pleuronectes platessa TaxID=8262 RepID=A0A9N7YBB1_PLEPL|nr:unnamed protein product [Pleuronectes platessa]